MVELLVPFLLFAIAMTITPGPNNVMVTASGTNFGFQRTLPHIAGIAAGFPVMVVALGLGLAAVFEKFPLSHQVLKVLGGAYLLYLAWRIATASPLSEGEPSPRRARPLTFLEAALFQWVNPKAWVLAVSALSTYTTGEADRVAQTLVMAAIFAAVCLPCVSAWAVVGTVIGRFLRAPRLLRAFNIAMATLLLASLTPAFLQ